MRNDSQWAVALMGTLMIAFSITLAIDATRGGSWVPVIVTGILGVACAVRFVWLFVTRPR